jgi:hypothetical protein
MPLTFEFTLLHDMDTWISPLVDIASASQGSSSGSVESDPEQPASSPRLMIPTPRTALTL